MLEGGIEEQGVMEQNRAAEGYRDATKPTFLYAEDNRELRDYVRGEAPLYRSFEDLLADCRESLDRYLDGGR